MKYILVAVIAVNRGRNISIENELCGKIRRRTKRMQLIDTFIQIFYV